MRRVLSFILVVAIAVGCKKKPSEMITAARKVVADVDAHLHDYTYREIDDIVSKDHGVIDGYFDGKEVKKLKTQYFGEKDRRFTAYYFGDGELKYVREEDYVYNKPNYYTQKIAEEAGDSVWYDDSKTKLGVSTYYFGDNKLIKWIAPGNRDMPANSEEFKQKETEVLARVVLALQQMKEE